MQQRESHAPASSESEAGVYRWVDSVGTRGAVLALSLFSLVALVGSPTRFEALRVAVSRRRVGLSARARGHARARPVETPGL
ncbi:unnamed protein product [Lampetra planeri]